MGVCPQVSDAFLPLESGLEVHGLDRLGGVGEVVVVTHADSEAIATAHRNVLLANDGFARAFEQDPVLVAIMVVRVDRRLFRIGTGSPLLVQSGLFWTRNTPQPPSSFFQWPISRTAWAPSDFPTTA